MQRKLYYINTKKLKEESGIYKNIYIDSTLEPKVWKKISNMKSQKDMTSSIKNIVQLYHYNTYQILISL